MSTVTWFEPQPHELPEVFPSPFNELGPHPLSRRAAIELQATLDGASEGKMFGVLVVQASDGRIGYLRSFSGMLQGRWEIEGFVPPVFDREAREQIEPAGEAAVKELLARFEALRDSSQRAESQAALKTLEARQEQERATLRARHEENRRRRHAERASASTPEALHALDQQSRGDKAERRRLEAAQERERAALLATSARTERKLRALERLRQFVCRRLMQRIHDTYVIPNARGERRPLRPLYARGEPPSGAADCAAPKLFASAYSMGLRPLALAEFWRGPPPASGGRIEGAFYPACKDKCGPLLPFMLEGLVVAAPRTFSPPDVAAEILPTVFEDEWIVVVEKPAGLLSVPARDEAVSDSVLARLRARYPQATGPLLVHRLDLDTSGLLIAAKDLATYTELQRQFAGREVRKRYIAWLEGLVAGERGTIDFPMRVDLNDRPRQIHDPVHGKAAVTEWEVLERTDRRTRVALSPHTGRTHQLRVHAAHPLGLGLPIVGDRLYGHEAERLHLHAESLELTHPRTGARVRFERPAPF